MALFLKENEGNNKIESSKLKIELEPTIFILLLPALIAILYLFK